MATPAPSLQETTQNSTQNHAQGLSRFREFPLEIRLMIWKAALEDEQQDRAVIFDRHSLRILPTSRLVSPFLVACSESRNEALKVYTTCLDVHTMPLTMEGDCACRGHGLPDDAVSNLGRRSGRLRLNLSTDRFALDAGCYAQFCLQHTMERHYHLLDSWDRVRPHFGPKYGYPYERAVTTRLSRYQAALVRKTLQIFPMEPSHGPGYIWGHYAGCYNYASNGDYAMPLYDPFHGASSSAILVFDTLAPWSVSQLLFRLSGLPLRDFIKIHGDVAQYLG